MSTRVIRDQMDDLQSLIQQAEQLTSKPDFNKRDEAQHALLLAKIAMVKNGVSGHEIRKAELARLRKELGLTENEIPAVRIKDPATVAQWRSFLRGEHDFDGSELRFNEGGSQSITSSNTSGSTFVPFGFDDRQAVLMSKYNLDAIVSEPFCTEFETRGGNGMTTPVVDDFSTAGSPPSVGASAIVSESSTDTQKDIVVGRIAWSNVPTWRSGRIFVTKELFDDAQYGTENVAGLIEAVVARRHAIGLGSAMITGAGLTGGLIVSLPSLTTITSASSTLALSDFITLYATLPIWYRAQANWYMSDNTRLVLHKLLETSSRPNAELPTQLFGRPIGICNSMTSAGAGNPAVVVIADPRYLQKRTAGTWLNRYVQTPGYVEAGMIGFAGFMRADFATALYGSGAPPVATLNQHS